MNRPSRRALITGASKIISISLIADLLQPLALGQSGSANNTSNISLSADAFNYLLNQSAVSAIPKLTNNFTKSSRSEYRQLCNRWRLVANHLSSSGFDSAMRHALPQLVQSGAYANIDQSSYGRSLDSAVRSVQANGGSVSKEQLVQAIGALPTSADPSTILKMQSMVNEGVSATCHRIADHFKLLSTGESQFSKVSYAESNQPHLVRVCTWKGKTPQQRFDSCQEAMYGIALILFFLSGIACLLSIACSAGLVTLAGAGLALTAFGAAAGLGNFLTALNCQRLLESSEPSIGGNKSSLAVGVAA